MSVLKFGFIIIQRTNFHHEKATPVYRSHLQTLENFVSAL